MITSSFDFDRSGVERRFTFQQLCFDRSPRSFSVPVAVSFVQRTPCTFNRKSKSLAFLVLPPPPPPRTTPINSFQTTKDYLAFQTEANAYRRQSGDNLWLRNRESVSAPSRFCFHQPTGSFDRRFRGSHVVIAFRRSFPS